jgi:uncharacterized protein YqhQ
VTKLPQPINEPARVGGMALSNGLLVHGPTSWAVAVRRDDGSIAVTSGRKPRLRLGPLERLPVLRGVLRLGEAMAVVPVARVRSPEARLAVEHPVVGMTVLGTAVASAAIKRRLSSAFAREAFGAVASLTPSVVLLGRSEAAMWHAVEHKSIAAYEDRGAAGVGEAAGYAKEHQRCGSNLVLPLLATSAIGGAIGRQTALGRTRRGRSVLALGGSGLAVEAFAFASRNPDHRLSKAIHGAGHFLQERFVTKEPAAGALDVGEAALVELLRLEGAGERL